MVDTNNSKYVRSFGGVLFRGIITLGVGIWIYMYTVLRHLQDEVTSVQQRPGQFLAGLFFCHTLFRGSAYIF
jgi:hypothetical protein